MRLLVSHHGTGFSEKNTCGQLGYLIIVEVIHKLYTETSNIKLLMLLVVCTLLKTHINKGFVLV